MSAMNKLASLVPALLLYTLPALAQSVPEPASRDLWCGIALGVVSVELPVDATEETRAMVQRFAAGSDMLIGRAAAAHLEAGYSEERFAAHLAAEQDRVAESLSGPD